MNYLKVYCNLIRKAENRIPPEGYTEKHHTFPKSIFGKNNRVVVLTAREHYVAHALLEKICIQRYGLKDRRTIKMTYAHTCMKSKGKYCNSYLYNLAVIRRSEAMKGKKPYVMTEEIRKKMSESSRGMIVSEETRQKISKIHKGKPLTEEHKKKISAANSGEKNFFYNMPFSQEHRKKISDANSGEKNGRAKMWKILFADGSEIKLNSVKKWAEENNYNISCISAVASKKQKYHKNIISIERY